MNPQVPQISMFSSLQPSLLSSSLSSLLLSPPDLHLVSSEGYSLASHSLLLTLYSSSLPSLLLSLPPSPTHSLSLPFPAHSLSSLLSLLTRGNSLSTSSFNPLEVIEAAELLGIDIEDISIVNREPPEDKENEDLTGTEHSPTFFDNENLLVENLERESTEEDINVVGIDENSEVKGDDLYVFDVGMDKKEKYLEDENRSLVRNDNENEFVSDELSILMDLQKKQEQ